ncbi:TonB-dependent receptor [Dysgonomonas sp. 520]|uniref:TonB-dependent receptor n=1 Tax=Dysgonomonas sp. 520 TaxID=2302931 RepID=UPI0013D5F2AE|nr:TonB-dependent receptor [Dysgonomonas sp. 520]NDW10492.1 TonB-dependent receptor [Dysgonomonas sp. 520]
MKKIILSIFLLLCLNAANADERTSNDTIYTELKTDVVILSSTKETNSLKSLPAAVSVLSQKTLEARQITSLKDLSSVVPNFFIPDYGSRMTAPIYIRGIGARTGTQTVSLYVDNIPYFNTCAFDAELYDIQRVEVLRGTQSTLYGRNSMGGIVNIYTYSPLTYEGKIASVNVGNHGLFSAQLSHHKKVSDKFGFSTSLYYKKRDGFFKNANTGKDVDNMESAGGRIKLNWQATPNFSAVLTSGFDFSDQGAFPYMAADSAHVNFDGKSSYLRRTWTNGLSLKYTTNSFVVNSTTGYQYLNDNMYLDQDFSPAPVFGINQRQKQHSFSEELTIKSNTKSNYQWSFGAFGFYDKLNLTSPVYMYKEGIDSLIHKNMNSVETMPLKVEITNDKLDFNSKFETPTYGIALFHQSTYSNLFNVKGLSATVGLRLDYEKTELNYDANTSVDFQMTMKKPPYMVAVPNLKADTVISGKTSTDQLELLPKFLMKYDINADSYIYASSSRGYKAGGHNHQLFADIIRQAMQEAMMSVSGRPSSTESIPIKDQITFKPEYSWNYELGGQAYFLQNALSVNLALYYINVSDVQISKFASNTGEGRMTVNAGKAESKGFEVGVKARPCKGFYLYANYGFADARFKDYKTNDKSGNEIDYSGNHIPFAPQQTFSVGTSISYDLKRSSIIDQIYLDASYSGAGRIYWTEANDKSQSFYGTVNARLRLKKKAFSLEFWTKNLFDKKYNAFYFDSMEGTPYENSFRQKGNPFQFGASLKVNL